VQTGTTATQGFFSHSAKICGPFSSYYQRAWSDLAITPLARQRNYNELSVLSVFGRIGKLVALALFLMRLIFEALFFRAARIWSSEGDTKVQRARAGAGSLGTHFFAAFPGILFFWVPRFNWIGVVGGRFSAA
jgi:hypothetical protein